MEGADIISSDYSKLGSLEKIKEEIDKDKDNKNNIILFCVDANTEEFSKNQSHWVALLINTQDNKAYYVDPMGTAQSI